MLFYYIRATGNAKCYGVIRYNKAKSTNGKKPDNMTSRNDLNVDLFKFSFGLFCDGLLNKTDIFVSLIPCLSQRTFFACVGSSFAHAFCN